MLNLLPEDTCQVEKKSLIIKNTPLSPYLPPKKKNTCQDCFLQKNKHNLIFPMILGTSKKCNNKTSVSILWIQINNIF